MIYNPDQKIPFYKLRLFGEKFNTTFRFIRQNSKVLIRASLYFCLPICVICGLLVNGVNDSIMSFGDSNAVARNPMDFVKVYGVLYLCSFLMLLVVSSMTVSVMQMYNDSKDKLTVLDMQEFLPYFKKNLVNFLKIDFVLIFLNLIVMAVFLVLIVVFAVFSSSGGNVETMSLGVILGLIFLVLILGIIFTAFMVFQALIPVVYVYEETTISEAITRGFKLAKRTFWGMLGFMIVVGLVACVISSVVNVPSYIMGMLKVFGLRFSELSFTKSPVFLVLSYLFSIVSTIGWVIQYVILFVASSYQYSHAAEVVDGISLKQDIAEFDHLDEGNNEKSDEIISNFENL